MSLKPMWKEGLFMMPQHLQLMDAYHEQHVNRRITASLSNAWGVSDLEVDADELARGVLAVGRCAAVMPDGLVVDAPKGLSAMVATSAGSRAAGKPVEVFLGVAAASVGGVSQGGANPGARYLHSALVLPDAFGSAQEAEVDCLAPNARLLLGDEDRRSYVTIKLAELESTESGRLALSERYIPPCLKVRASPVIMTRLERLVSALGAKQKELVGKYGDRTAAIVEFGAADIATFFYLHTVNTWLPVFMHAADGGELHPEQLYVWLASLAGQLASFEATTDPLALPRYRHAQLGATFVPLFDLVFQLLGTVVSARYESIVLEQQQPGLFVGRGADPQLLRARQLYLIAGGDVPEETLRDDLPRYIKVGSIDQIAKIVHSALPGVTVRIDFSPPNAIPVRSHMVYLKLDKQGRYWESVIHSGTIAIYQPVKPERIKLELVAVEA
jgi:type VI secretion system protein ImpJ